MFIKKIYVPYEAMSLLSLNNLIIAYDTSCGPWIPCKIFSGVVLYGKNNLRTYRTVLIFNPTVHC